MSSKAQNILFCPVSAWKVDNKLPEKVKTAAIIAKIIRWISQKPENIPFLSQKQQRKASNQHIWAALTCKCLVSDWKSVNKI